MTWTAQCLMIWVESMQKCYVFLSQMVALSFLSVNENDRHSSQQQAIKQQTERGKSPAQFCWQRRKVSEMTTRLANSFTQNGSCI